MAEEDESGGLLREIGHLASWSVTSAKPGNGVELLRDGDTATFWQCVSRLRRRAAPRRARGGENRACGTRPELFRLSGLITQTEAGGPGVRRRARLTRQAFRWRSSATALPVPLRASDCQRL
jgi:hypothetical protein